MTLITLREYGTLYRGQTSGFVSSPTQAELPIKAFDALKSFLISPAVTDRPIFTLGTRDRREALFLSSWVGVLETPDGTQIEILPKIFSTNDEVTTTRRLFIKMLSTLANFPSTEWKRAGLQGDDLPLMEFFAVQFVYQVAKAVRHGVARTYEGMNQDLPALRGRLDLNRHLLQQSVKPSLLAVQADLLTVNRPENRAIKTALVQIRSLIQRPEHRRLYTQLLDILWEVPVSKRPLADLESWVRDRSFKQYTSVWPLTELILRGHSPVAPSGGAQVYTLLFPMEKIFESYVAACLRRSRDNGGQLLYHHVQTQVSTEHLVFQGDRKLFSLRPDLILTLPCGQVVIADTKWKRLDAALGNRAGLQISDLYQMFAYGHKYLNGKGEIYLIYPMTQEFTQPLENLRFDSAGRLTVHVYPFDIERGQLKV